MTEHDVNLEMVDKVVELMPEASWPLVKQTIITTLVDNMPGSVLEKLTGSYEDFELAESILNAHYKLPGTERELIIDAFKIMGETFCLEVLNSLSI